MGQSISREWEKIYNSRGWGQYPSESVIRFVAENYYDKCRKDIKILDFGCGQGAHTWYLAREGFDTYAFDGSASAVKKTSDLLMRDNLSGHLAVIDGINIDFSAGYFDAVIDSACIGHNTISDIRIMYKKIYNILKPDGKIFTSFFSVDTTGYGTGQELEDNTFTNISSGPLTGLGTVHFGEKEQLYNELNNIGFANICIDSQQFTRNGDIISMYISTAIKRT